MRPALGRSRNARSGILTDFLRTPATDPKPMSTDPFTQHPWVLVGMSVAVVAGMVWLRRVWLSVRGEDDTESCTPDDLLTPLARAHRAGQMSDEEYRRIRASIVTGESDPPITPRGGPSSPEGRPDR